MSKQKWFCEVCKVRGEVEYEKRSDVMSVCYLISDAHEKTRPNCSNSMHGLRVLNEPLATEADWALFNSMTPVSV